MQQTKESEYDEEMPQSQTADQPRIPRGRNKELEQDSNITIKALSSSARCFPKVERELTVLPAKSDSDVMFCLQRYQGLKIDIPLPY